MVSLYVRHAQHHDDGYFGINGHEKSLQDHTYGIAKIWEYPLDVIKCWVGLNRIV